jgi:hypothetical protein
MRGSIPIRSTPASAADEGGGLDGSGRGECCREFGAAELSLPGVLQEWRCTNAGGPQFGAAALQASH